MTEDKLVEIREKLIELVENQLFCENQYRDKELATQIVDDELQYPITKTGGVCPECVGVGRLRHLSLTSTHKCPTCHGTGKLPDETHSLREIIEEYLR